MKKLLCFVLVFIMTVSMFAVTASADSFVDSETTPDFTGETEIAYRAYSTYYVTIPTTVGVGESCTISVSMGNIESGYHINVYVTNSDSGKIVVYSDNYDENKVTGKLSILHDDTIFTGDNDGLLTSYYPEGYGEYDSASTTLTFEKALDAMTEPFKPGSYHGTVCFKVECVKD